MLLSDNYSYGRCTIQLAPPWASTNLRPVKLYEWRPTFPDSEERLAACSILLKMWGLRYHWTEVLKASRDLKPVTHWVTLELHKNLNKQGFVIV